MRSSTRKRVPRKGSPQDIYRTLHNLVVGTVALWVLVVVFAIGGLLLGKKEVSQIQRDEALAARALCTERANYDTAIKSTKDFLKHHPHGIPGISRAVFLRGLRQTEQARLALADIHCN